MIVLKFLKNFRIEQSDDCVYDYLEIRDGQYGYSPLIGRFCDSNVPILPIESTSRDLWIKFQSDDSIQDEGFRIFYEYKKIPKSNSIENFAKLSLGQLSNSVDSSNRTYCYLF